MKTNELMLGDWLLAIDREGSDDVPDGQEITYPIQVDTIFGDTILDHYGCERGDCDFRGLPLTSELLEQSGWQRIQQAGCAEPYHWLLEKYEDEDEEYPSNRLYRVQAFKTFFRGLFITIENPSDCEPISFGQQLEHVHQLQHALRLCCIDREITVKTEE